MRRLVVAAAADWTARGLHVRPAACGTWVQPVDRSVHAGRAGDADGLRNQPGVTAVVSIHADGARADGHGFHVCESSQQPAGAAVAAQSHRLTVAVHDALVNGSGLSTSTYLGANGYYPRADVAALNLAVGPSTFRELGNTRNAGDAALLSSAPGRARVAAGILAFLGR